MANMNLKKYVVNSIFYRESADDFVNHLKNKYGVECYKLENEEALMVDTKAYLSIRPSQASLWIEQNRPFIKALDEGTI